MVRNRNRKWQKIKITGNDLLRMKNGAYRKVEQLKINDEIAVKN